MDKDLGKQDLDWAELYTEGAFQALYNVRKNLPIVNYVQLHRYLASIQDAINDAGKDFK